MSAGLDNSLFHAIPVVLNGDNFNEWSHAICRMLKGRSKMKYIDENSQPLPSSDDAKSQTWVAEDAVVSGWLINSMIPSLRRCLMYLTTSKEIWDAVKAAFGARGNSSKIFDINAKVWDLKQESFSLGDYYIAKTTLWNLMR